MLCIWCSINKIETIKYHTVGTILKSYRKIIERGKIDCAKIYDLWPSWFDTGTTIKSCKVKLVLNLPSYWNDAVMEMFSTSEWNGNPNILNHL